MSQPIGADLFAGAGGMSLGAVQAGIRVDFAVESDANAGLTYKKNFPTTRLFPEDIRSVSSLMSLRQDKEPVILFGGPPCQGFSTSNQRTRGVDNRNNWLYEEFIRVAQLIDPLPEWIVFENVKGFTETEDGLFLENVMASLRSLGYSVTAQKLNATEFGVPQKRTRFFAVASREGIEFEFPNATHAVPITVEEALSDLPRLTTGASEHWQHYHSEATSNYARSLRGEQAVSPNHHVTRNSASVLARYQHIPPGGNWQHIPPELMGNYKDATRCHTGIYHRLDSNRPSIVIGNYRKNMLIHPLQNRGLSVREAARLQSFPDWFEFMGSIGFQQQQVGNAVPPLLAEAVFRRIMQYINPPTYPNNVA